MLCWTALVYNTWYSRFYAIVYLSAHEATDVHDSPLTSYARRCHRIDFKGGFAGTQEAGHALGGPHHSQAVGDGAGSDRGRARCPETPLGRTLAGGLWPVPGTLGEHPLVAWQGDRPGPPDPAEPDCRPVVARVGIAGGGPCLPSTGDAAAPAALPQRPRDRAGAGSERGPYRLSRRDLQRSAA